MAELIVVTGAVGSGKTTTAKLLAKLLRWDYLDLNSLLLKYPALVTGFDKKRDSKIVDVKKMNTLLKKVFAASKRSIVFDSHLSHYLSPSLVDLCVVTTCSLPVLKKRLQKRKYAAGKVRENLDAAIFDVCLVEALESGHELVLVDTEQEVKKQCQEILQLYFPKRR